MIILKTTDCVDELQAVKEKVDVDIARQRSKDTGGEDGEYCILIIYILIVTPLPDFLHHMHPIRLDVSIWAHDVFLLNVYCLWYDFM